MKMFIGNRIKTNEHDRLNVAGDIVWYRSNPYSFQVQPRVNKMELINGWMHMGVYSNQQEPKMQPQQIKPQQKHVHILCDILYTVCISGYPFTNME